MNAHRILLSVTTVFALLLLSGCGDSAGDDEKATIEVSLPGGGEFSTEISTNNLRKSTEPRDPALTFRAGKCLSELGSDASCLSIYSVDPGLSDTRPIDEFDEAVQYLALAGSFTVCADNDVPNQLFVDVMAIVKRESSTGALSIRPYPCM